MVDEIIVVDGKAYTRKPVKVNQLRKKLTEAKNYHEKCVNQIAIWTKSKETTEANIANLEAILSKVVVPDENKTK